MIDLAGTRVETTERYASQFPSAIARNNGKPRTGTIKRVRSDKLLVVKWDNAKSDDILHADFIRSVEQ